MATAKEYTTDHLICVCISRQVEDGEVVVQGIATPLVAAGYALAKLTHAPQATFASAIGNAVCQRGAPLALAHREDPPGRASSIIVKTGFGLESAPDVRAPPTHSRGG